MARLAARAAAASSQAGRREKAPLLSSNSSRMAQKSGDSSRYRRGPAPASSRFACPNPFLTHHIVCAPAVVNVKYFPNLVL